ncbi:biotin/lipoyl-containing protein, partial [Halorubrum sp. GN11GM_10-3_MGM]|uniref:biotin/lipoyl-containing protein n=1 Tax=Halorubrum sp. GN11GM_10-3_MGM TaxID=2518111 RepID=UPI00113BD87C
MTVKEFKLPDVGEGVAEGELVSWLVAPGDRVAEDQPVAEVETDKALVEVPSSYDGTVEELFVEEGEMVPVGDVIISFRVDEDGDDAGTEVEAEPEPASTDESASEPATEAADAEPDTPSGRTFAPPSARRLARELGVDVAAVDGSGPGGRVSEADVRAHAEGADGSASSDGADDGPEPRPSPTPTDVGSGDRKSAVSKRGANGPAGSSTATAAGWPEPAGRETTLATPATRKVARERDVDIDDVPTDETRD